MLARWFDRSGIGQALAPDPDAAPVSENDESRSVVWQFLAPDEKFALPKAPPGGAFPPATTATPTTTSSNDGYSKKVQCVHCHNWTPVYGVEAPAMIETIVPASPGVVGINVNNVNSSKSVAPPQTPVTPKNDGTNSGDVDLNSRVLSACRDTSMFMRSPNLERKNNDKFLRLCASTTKLNPKLMKKMKSMVKANSYRDAYLLRVRATKLGQTAPDGYTALQVTAYANHLEAAKLLLELAKDYAGETGDDTGYTDLHLDRDMFGMTALHIAAERGHVEMIQFLVPLYQFPNPPGAGAGAGLFSKATGAAGNDESSTAGTSNSNHVPLIDLGGQTAFGRAVTSPVPKAKKNQRTLEKNLFSNNDLSIFGHAKPIEKRMGSFAGLGLGYGTSDMPGMRGYMEDAMSVESWLQESSNSGGLPREAKPMVLFAVCDGHGDNGRVSRFIASGAAGVLRECIRDFEMRNRDIVPSEEYWDNVWHAACLKLDEKLKEAHLTEGGSTGVFALVTEQEIVVANVGDSRCILSRTQTNENDVAGGGGAAAYAAAGETPAGESSASAEPPPLVPEGEGAEASTMAPPAVVEDDSNRGSTTTATQTTVVTALSEDHKPNLPDEAARIKMAGFGVESTPIVEEDGSVTTIHKIVKNEKNQLAVSRAFGDFDYKANTTLGPLEQAVVPLASVVVHTRDLASDRYMVLACDGIWDVLENDAVIELVEERAEAIAVISPTTVLPDVADVLLHECLGKDSRDNLSAILVSVGGSTTTTTTTPAAMPPKALDFGSPS